jgi:hypothetical protein
MGCGSCLDLVVVEKTRSTSIAAYRHVGSCGCTLVDVRAAEAVSRRTLFAQLDALKA